jgi:hypothetical protein
LVGLERAGLEREDLKRFVTAYPLKNKTFRFHNASCSCIIELREGVTTSRIFSQNGIFPTDVLYMSQKEKYVVAVLGGEGGAQRPRFGFQ